MRKVPRYKYIQTAKCVFKNILRKEAIYPFYASFKTTRKCNFTCSFCNCWHVKNKWKDLSTEDMKRIIDNIASSSVIVCSFEGGDPLVRDDIHELLKYQWEKPFYLLFTTSERDLADRYPMEEYSKYIDFLHISIDEGHENLDMFDELDTYTKWGSVVTVQLVVTTDTVDELEWKIKRCYEAGTKAVVMIAVHLESTRDHFPDVKKLSETGLRLKEKYPGVIISPDGYFKRMLAPHGCDTSSLIIDADGMLWYPCRVLEGKTINLAKDPLMPFLESDDAHRKRVAMSKCEIACGWYQYYATSSFVNPLEFFGAWSPYFRDLVDGGKQSYYTARPEQTGKWMHGPTEGTLATNGGNGGARKVGGPGLLGCRGCGSMNHGGDGSACHRTRVADLEKRGLPVKGPRFGPPVLSEKNEQVIPLMA